LRLAREAVVKVKVRREPGRTPAARKDLAA
jgi:hypothetical protein